jgi:UDP-N-acetylglucosamine 3-dehydrogenase
MGRQHAKAWHARADADVVAVFDPIEERCEALAGELGARKFSGWDEAIECEGVDVVSVCTPTCFHSEIARFAASRERHVLTEKPLATSLAEGEAMIRSAQEHDVLLGVSLQYRDFARNRRLKEVVDSGSFGGPLFVRYVDVRDIRPKVAMHRRSMNNGPVLDMACHYFDFMRYLTGAEPVTVFATGHVFGQGKPALEGVDDVAIDAADIQVRFENGHVLSVFVNWGMPNGYENVPGELVTSPTSMARNDGDEFKIVVDGREESVEMKGAGPEGRIANLAEAIQGKEELEITGENGLAALRVSLAAFESIEAGRAVEVEEVQE